MEKDVSKLPEALQASKRPVGGHRSGARRGRAARRECDRNAPENVDSQQE